MGEERGAGRTCIFCPRNRCLFPHPAAHVVPGHRSLHLCAIPFGRKLPGSQEGHTKHSEMGVGVPGGGCHCGVCMPKAWVGSQASCSPGHPALTGSEPGGHLCPSRGKQCQSLRAGKVMLIYTIFKQVYFTQLCSQARFLIDPTRSHTHAPHPHEHLGACAQGHLWVIWGQGTLAVKSS